MKNNNSKKELFVTRCSPIYWLETAEELKECCERLIKDFVNNESLCITYYPEPINNNNSVSKLMISKGFFLLAGFVVENLVKGIIICQNPSLINTGKLHGSIKTHNLVKLIGLIDDIKLTEDCLMLLKNLSDALPYWGRYPVPLIAEKMEIEKYLDTDVIGLFEKLYRKLHRKLVVELRKDWISGLPDDIGSITNAKIDTFEDEIASIE